MVKIDSGIVVETPPSWQQFTDRGRCVFHTPQREEIIVSASRVTGTETESERLQAVERVFAGGLEAARRGVSHPDLRITKALAEDSSIANFRCATVFAETTARDAFFGQAVFQHSEGIVFLTYEAPFVDGAEQAFGDLLRMIREVRESA
jgi:hypothetical protein